MSSYQGSTSVQADAKSVFDFVSRPENLPQYVPFIQQADCGYGDVLHISGECPHGAFRGVGGFLTDPEAMSMHWNSRASVNYRGWLHVTDHEDHCLVVIHLEFDPGLDAEANKEFHRVLKEHPASMQSAIDQALGTIRSRCEQAVAPV